MKLNSRKILDELASKLYLIGKPHVSSFQSIKRHTIWSFLEEVLRILLKVVQGWWNVADFHIFEEGGFSILLFFE